MFCFFCCCFLITNITKGEPSFKIIMILACSVVVEILWLHKNYYKRGCSNGGGLSWLFGLVRLGEVIFIPTSYDNFSSHSTEMTVFVYITWSNNFITFYCFIIVSRLNQPRSWQGGLGYHMNTFFSVHF